MDVHWDWLMVERKEFEKVVQMGEKMVDSKVVLWV